MNRVKFSRIRELNEYGKSSIEWRDDEKRLLFCRSAFFCLISVLRWAFVSWRDGAWPETASGPLPCPFSPFLQNNFESSRCRKENWDKHHTQSSGLMSLLPLIFFFSKMTASLPWEEPNLCCERIFCRCGWDHYWHNGRMLRVGFCTTNSLWWKRNKEVKKDKSGPFVWIKWDFINTKLTWRRKDKPIIYSLNSTLVIGFRRDWSLCRS